MHNVSSTAREPSCCLLKRELWEMKHFTWYPDVGCCDSETKVACNQLHELLLPILTLHFMQAGPASSRAQVSLRGKVFKAGVQSVTYHLGTYILLGQDKGPSRSNTALFWRHTEPVPIRAVAASLHITDLVANVHIFTAATLSVVPSRALCACTHASHKHCVCRFSPQLKTALAYYRAEWDRSGIGAVGAEPF